jgi:hypothetical protein
MSLPDKRQRHAWKFLEKAQIYSLLLAGIIYDASDPLGWLKLSVRGNSSSQGNYK